MAAGGDGVTALHDDGGLRTFLSGAVLSRWENERMQLISNTIPVNFVIYHHAFYSCMCPGTDVINVEK